MYSPKIKPELVRQLYKLKHFNSNNKKKTPMTKLVNEAVSEYLERNGYLYDNMEANTDEGSSVFNKSA